MAAQSPQLPGPGGKERLGERVLHIEGSFSTPRGETRRFGFNVRRGLNRLFFGRVSERELDEVRARLAALPGSPEGVDRVEKGKAGPQETVQEGRDIRSRRVHREVTQRVAEVRTVKDYTPALTIAQNMSDRVRATERQHHETLVSQGKAFHVGAWYESSARRIIYGKRGQEMASAVANALVINPEQAIEEAATYIDQRYLGKSAQGETLSRGERFLKNRVVWGVLSAVPILGQALTLWDDVNTLSDVFGRKPGTLRGKLLFQGGAALLSDIINIASGYLEFTVAGIPIAEILTQVTNQILNPASIEHARLRVEDQRFMLQMHTTAQLLSPYSGISHAKRLEIAQAAVNQLGSRITDIDSHIKGTSTDPETYYAQLMKGVYTIAQSVISTGTQRLPNPR